MQSVLTPQGIRPATPQEEARLKIPREKDIDALVAYAKSKGWIA